MARPKKIKTLTIKVIESKKRPYVEGGNRNEEYFINKQTLEGFKIITNGTGCTAVNQTEIAEIMNVEYCVIWQNFHSKANGYNKKAELPKMYQKMNIIYV